MPSVGFKLETSVFVSVTYIEETDEDVRRKKPEKEVCIRVMHDVSN